MTFNKKNKAYKSSMNIGDDNIDAKLDKIIVIQKKRIGGEICDNCRKVSDNHRKNKGSL